MVTVSCYTPSMDRQSTRASRVAVALRRVKRLRPRPPAGSAIRALPTISLLLVTGCWGSEGELGGGRRDASTAMPAATGTGLPAVGLDAGEGSSREQADAGAESRLFDTEDCDQYCIELRPLQCTAAEQECLIDCLVGTTAFGGTICHQVYSDMMRCAQRDPLNRVECDAEGVPMLRQDACVVEQDAFVMCAFNGG
jgi:hypothetical protein